MADNFGGWEQVARNMKAFGGKTRADAIVLMNATVGRTVNEAKRTAPWHDRTGNARRSIRGQVNVDGNGNIVGTVGMGGEGLEYTKVLELGHAGKYRVIDPTVFGFGAAELRKDLGDLRG